MNKMFRILLLLKVLVMLSLGTSMAWAECENHGTQASSGQAGHAGLLMAASDSEGGDKGQGGSAGDDSTDDPSSDDSEEGDSQS